MADYFTDRITEHPGRIQLTAVSGQTDVYDVERAEGAVTEPGTPFNADTFNDIANQIIQSIITDAELTALAEAMGVSTARLYALLGSLAGRPYVVEQGTTDGWTYRKWSDGAVEAWASNVSFGSQTPAVWISPIRYKDITGTIPSGIFTAAPSLQVTSATAQWWVNNANATSPTSYSARLSTVASSAQQTFINIFAKGR